MSISDFFGNLFSSFQNRVKTPFLASFGIAWLICNWRPISILLMSDLEVIKRIYIIENNYAHLELTLWIPLIYAISYIVIFPWIMFGLDKISSFGILQRKLFAIDQKANMIIMQESIIEAQDRIEKKKISLRENKAENDYVESLKLENESLTSNNESLRLRLKDTNKQLDSLNGKRTNVSNLSLTSYDKGFNEIDAYERQDYTNAHEQKLLKELSRSSEKVKQSLRDEYLKFRSESEIIEFFPKIIGLVGYFTNLEQHVPNDVYQRFMNLGLIEKRKNGTKEVITLTLKGVFFKHMYINLEKLI